MPDCVSAQLSLHIAAQESLHDQVHEVIVTDGSKPPAGMVRPLSWSAFWISLDDITTSLIEVITVRVNEHNTLAFPSIQHQNPTADRAPRASDDAVLYVATLPSYSHTTK